MKPLKKNITIYNMLLFKNSYKWVNVASAWSETYISYGKYVLQNTYISYGKYILSTKKYIFYQKKRPVYSLEFWLKGDRKLSLKKLYVKYVKYVILNGKFNSICVRVLYTLRLEIANAYFLTIVKLLIFFTIVKKYVYFYYSKNIKEVFSCFFNLKERLLKLLFLSQLLFATASKWGIEIYPLLIKILNYIMDFFKISTNFNLRWFSSIRLSL